MTAGGAWRRPRMKVYDYNQEFGGNYYQVLHVYVISLESCWRKIYFAQLSIHLILSNSRMISLIRNLLTWKDISSIRQIAHAFVKTKRLANVNFHLGFIQTFEKCFFKKPAAEWNEENGKASSEAEVKYLGKPRTPFDQKCKLNCQKTQQKLYWLNI